MSLPSSEVTAPRLSSTALRCWSCATPLLNTHHPQWRLAFEQPENFPEPIPYSGQPSSFDASLDITAQIPRRYAYRDSRDTLEPSPLSPLWVFLFLLAHRDPAAIPHCPFRFCEYSAIQQLIGFPKKPEQRLVRLGEIHHEVVPLPRDEQHM